MRLTLRTLLAYIDNVLSPTDAATLKQKIQESPKAEQLAERIRNSLTRTELAVMPALGQGNEDPNVPAEYLDSTLPEAQVADFEQACLATDVRLTEVADCHKILAEVLTKPVHVPRSFANALTDWRMPRSPTILLGPRMRMRQRIRPQGLRFRGVGPVETVRPMETVRISASCFPRLKSTASYTFYPCSECRGA